MNQFVKVESFFSHVYLVDLSPSLLEVARKRFERLGWKNVSVVCQDAREFRLPGAGDGNGCADLVTMSYSLSMIPGMPLRSSFAGPCQLLTIPLSDYYSVVDSMTRLLKSTGIIGVCDFYGTLILSDYDRFARH